MMPAFTIEGGLWLALARAAWVAALLSVFGTLLFRAFVARRSFAAMPQAAVDRVRSHLLLTTRISLAAAALGGLTWIVAQAADMAGAASLAGAVSAAPAIVTGTAFGHLMALQLAVLLAVAALARRPVAALALATVALALQAGHSHAASMYAGPSWLLAANVVHLLGAGAWLGGLLPLLLLVRDASAGAGATAARWFSPLGKLCVVALAATAAFQGWVEVASIPGLVGTAYGWTALAKLALFGVLFGFAVANRYRLAPALLRDDPIGAKRALVRSIAVQTGFGLLIVAVAAVLSSLPPAMHAQPVWPFADRFTLDTIGEDPDFRREVLGAVLALAGAAALLVAAAFIRRRMRWAAVAGAAAVAWFAVPHLDLLFVPAYPTSFCHSPTSFAASSIVQGAALFPSHCAVCHGAAGHGDGPAAKGLPVPPADLTAAHLWMHSDGELFWWLAHGIEAPEGGVAMPGFAGVLSEDQRWALIDYIRAHNAGLTFHGAGAWTPALHAPGLQTQCADGRTASLADLRGGFVRLVIGMAGAAPGVTTVLATSGPAAKPAPGLCIASDEGLAQAYAIVSGVPPSAMPGTEFLIDGAGWLRAMQAPEAAPGWNDPRQLSAEIAQLAAHPLPADAGAVHMSMQNMQM